MGYLEEHNKFARTRMMKELSTYILEQLKAGDAAKVFVNSIRASKITTDQIKVMLNNFQTMQDLKFISDYLEETDGKNYISYQPADDEFLSDKNKESIIDRIAEYLNKNITQK
jgi:hypothetical protein